MSFSKKGRYVRQNRALGYKQEGSDIGKELMRTPEGTVRKREV